MHAKKREFTMNKIVLDTNVVISALLSADGNPARLLALMVRTSVDTGSLAINTGAVKTKMTPIPRRLTPS